MVRDEMGITGDHIKILIPMIRKVMPTLIAQDIVGVQPMGPLDPPTDWRAYLKYLYKKYVMWKPTTDCNDKIEQLTEMMQERYPGEYVVAEKLNEETQEMQPYLKFTDPRYELMFNIKWA